MTVGLVVLSHFVVLARKYFALSFFPLSIRATHKRFIRLD